MTIKKTPGAGKSKKFTEDEIQIILELYPTHTKKQISDIIGKTVNCGNLQVIKNWHNVESKDFASGKVIVLENADKILALANEGWKKGDICKKLGLERHLAELFRLYIPGFSTHGYSKYGPDIKKEVIRLYSEELRSIIDINKQFGIDTHRIQDMLKEVGVLRNYRETFKLKKEAGLYPAAEQIRHMYKDPNQRFSDEFRSSVREAFNNCCVKCGKTNANSLEQTKKQLCVHHIFPYQNCKQNVFDNMVPLCYECHMEVHAFMRKNKNVFKEMYSLYHEDVSKMVDYFFETFL